MARVQELPKGFPFLVCCVFQNRQAWGMPQYIFLCQRTYLGEKQFLVYFVESFLRWAQNNSKETFTLTTRGREKTDRKTWVQEWLWHLTRQHWFYFSSHRGLMKTGRNCQGDVVNLRGDLSFVFFPSFKQGEKLLCCCFQLSRQSLQEKLFPLAIKLSLSLVYYSGGTPIQNSRLLRGSVLQVLLTWGVSYSLSLTAILLFQRIKSPLY